MRFIEDNLEVQWDCEQHHRPVASWGTSAAANEHFCAGGANTQSSMSSSGASAST